MKPMIEPVAGRLFDIYYQYTAKSDLVALQSLTEEAYKLHERLKRLPPLKVGLFDIDEFLLLKTLRNYSVHQDDFLGKAYAINRAFAEKNRLDLVRVCLVEKKVVKVAINAEPPLEFGEDNKIARIQSQLVDFGDCYNIEPVIFNFMVKVYEKLITMNFSIPGKGFSEIHEAYQNEIYYNFPHYVPLTSDSVKPEDILANITPLEDINISENEGLTPESEDPFNIVASLEIDCSGMSVFEYAENDYQAMHDALLSKIVNDDVAFAIAQYLPNHLGLAFVHSTDDQQPSEVTAFNISKQKTSFEKQNIELDSLYYQTTGYELLVLLILDETIYPVVISKDTLFEYMNSIEAVENSTAIDIDLPDYNVSSQVNIPNNWLSQPEKKVGRNDPCPCGSGKKYKKCCLQ